MSNQKYHASCAPLPEEGMQPPIITAPPQPNADGWLPSSTTYPPSLEYLIDLDYLFMNQKMLPVFTGWETKNTYAITNIRNKPVYYIIKESGVRSFEFNVYNKERRKVLRIVRFFQGFFEQQVLEVYSGSTLLGSVTQEWSLLRPTFYIRDASGQPVLVLKGPIIRFCIETTFKIKSMDEQHRVGIIQKQWTAQEFSTVSDNFGINFPKDLDVKIKAVLLGASLLINFIYFEQSSNQIESSSDPDNCYNFEQSSNQIESSSDPDNCYNFEQSSNQIESSSDPDNCYNFEQSSNQIESSSDPDNCYNFEQSNEIQNEVDCCNCLAECCICLAECDTDCD